VKPWEILQGDVRQVLRTLPSDHFDAVLSDPPYGLAFMGNRWDYKLPSVHVWLEMRRAMKPGARALLFGGSRTFHRLAVAVEDAGLVPIDTLMWLHGQGFPKSLAIDKAIDKHLKAERVVTGKAGKLWEKWEENATGKGRPRSGLRKDKPATASPTRWLGYGTQLKPAFEPCLMVEKPLEGTYAENALQWGVAGLAIDESRIGMREARSLHRGATTGLGLGYGSGAGPQKVIDGGVGRWPSNVLLDEEAAALLDEQSGERPSGIAVQRNGGGGRIFGSENGRGPVADAGYSDSGGASRFFFVAKAGRSQRESGCDALESADDGTLQGGGENANDPVSKRFTKKAKNIHPTVKPIDLVRYMARMLLPPSRETPRTILVPYSGSGSEMIGCLQAGWDRVVGIEREAEYITIARARLSKGGVLSRLMKEKR
jgi:DNA modification methylase